MKYVTIIQAPFAVVYDTGYCCMHTILSQPPIVGVYDAGDENLTNLRHHLPPCRSPIEQAELYKAGPPLR